MDVMHFLLSDRLLPQRQILFHLQAKPRKTMITLPSCFAAYPASAQLAAKVLKIPEGVRVTALALFSRSAPCDVDARIIIEVDSLSYGWPSTSLPSLLSRPVSQPTHNRSESGREHYLIPPPELSNTMLGSSMTLVASLPP